MGEIRAEAAWGADEIEAAAWRDMVDAAPPALGMGWAKVGGATLLTAPRLPSQLFNRAIGIGNGAPATDALIDEVLVRMTATGAHDPWIQISAAARPQASIARWLEARRFAPAVRRSWAKVVRGREAPPPIDVELAIRELDRADAAPLARVVCAAHALPSDLAPLIDALVGRPWWRAYGAFDGDALVAGGVMRCDGRVAWLGLGATLPSHRGRGAQGALMSRRITDAIAQGASTIATETAMPIDGEKNASLDNMRRCGFELVGARTNWALVR